MGRFEEIHEGLVDDGQGRRIGVDDPRVLVDDQNPHPQRVDHGLMEVEGNQQFHGVAARKDAAGLQDFLLARRLRRPALQAGDELV